MAFRQWARKKTPREAWEDELGLSARGECSGDEGAGDLGEALLQMPVSQGATRTQMGAIVLCEAMQLNCFEKYPEHPRLWTAYQQYSRWCGKARIAVPCLLCLSVFEAPPWCEVTDMWDWRQLEERCWIDGVKPQDIVMSGVPIVCVGFGLIVEYTLYSVLLVKLFMELRIQKMFRSVGARYVHTGWLLFETAMVIMAIGDCVSFTIWPGKFRLAPLVRCGLALALPIFQPLLEVFYKILVAISKVGIFLSGTIIVFAWITALLFQDLEIPARSGLVNQGFATFGESLYTAFVASTTCNLPDAMVPTYEYSRSSVFIWMIFFLLAVIIYLQVVLAVVYNKYSDVKTEMLKVGYSNREKGIQLAFQALKQPDASPKGEGEPGTSEDERVFYETFEEVLLLMKACDNGIDIDSKLMRFVYQALDDDGNGTICLPEFVDMCDVIQYHFVHVRRDAWLRRALKDTPYDKLMTWFMHNQTDWPDLGFQDKFPGSPFDVLVKGILFSNVMFIVIESVYDLSHWEEPAIFPVMEGLFSFIYLFDVGMKLCWWSFAEFWHGVDNRVDLILTLSLASAGVGAIYQNVSRSVLRGLNMIRLVRLVKALNQIDSFQETCTIMARMVTTCQDVLLLNMLVIYLWSCCGVQLFGGELYRGNIRYEQNGFNSDDMDYFNSNFQIYNFNDVPLSFVTLFFFMITNWVDQVASACLSLSEAYSPYWWASYFYMVSFYIASPLIAFNLFTAFAIDVYCKLQEYAEAQDKEENTEVYRNLKHIQEQQAEEGYCLHVAPTAALLRAKVYRDMFPPEDEDEDEEEGDGDKEEEDAEGGGDGQEDGEQDDEKGTGDKPPEAGEKDGEEATGDKPDDDKPPEGVASSSSQPAKEPSSSKHDTPSLRHAPREETEESAKGKGKAKAKAKAKSRGQNRREDCSFDDWCAGR